MKKNCPITVTLLFVSFATAMIMTSCKNKVKLQDPTTEELDEINDIVLTIDTTHTLLPSTAAKGETWTAWDQVFNSCFKNETFKKNKVYLGPSNPRYLGTILSKKKNATRRELTALVPISEFSKFATIGQPVNNCDLTSVRDFSMDLLLGVATTQMTDSLKLAISNYDSTKITGGQWQIDELRIDDFLDYINESNDPKVKKYKASLLENGNLVLTKVIKVSGFRAEIYSSREIKGGVAASLTTGQSLDVIKPDSTNNNNTFQVRLDLNKSKKNTVNVSSNGVFYIYGMALKGSKL